MSRESFKYVKRFEVSLFIMDGWVVGLLCLVVLGSVEGGHLQRKYMQRTMKTPTVEGSLPPDQWFQQRLDHFDPTNTATWWQRYHTNATWFKGTVHGPIFLTIGGEWAIEADGVVKGAWMAYAEIFGALCFQLEHRFYGKSQPTGDLTVKSLRFLTSEQALADIAYFIEGMKEKYKLTTENKWVVFGGSYPGSLAAWARLKYPHLIHAAVSSSAPLVALMNFRSFNDALGRSLRSQSQKCADNIHYAVLEIFNNIYKPSMAAQYSTLFNLCDPIDLREHGDVANFFDLLMNTIQMVVQYHIESTPSGVEAITNIDTTCRIMTDSSFGTVVERYAVVSKLLNNNCLDISYYNGISELQNTTAPADSRAWTYQTCVEFGWYQTSSSRNEIFGLGIPLQYFLDQCKAVFGHEFDFTRTADGIKRSNIAYGQKEIINHVTNVMFLHGSLDPWRLVGIYKSTNPRNPALLIDRASHTTDTNTPFTSDPPQLVQARHRVVSFLGDVLSQYGGTWADQRKVVK